MWTWATSAWMQGAWGPSAKRMPFSWEGLPILSIWVLLVKFKSSVSESSQPTKRCSLPSSSLPFHSSSNPLVMWGIIGAGSPRRAKTSSFYQSEAPRPPWVETAARVHFYLYPLQGSFFVHWPVVPLVHHPTCRHLSHLSSWVLPGPDAGFPNMPC